jgi:hypothetical protein
MTIPPASVPVSGSSDRSQGGQGKERWRRSRQEEAREVCSGVLISRRHPAARVKVAADTIRIAALMKRANIRARVESIVANLIAFAFASRKSTHSGASEMIEE